MVEIMANSAQGTDLKGLVEKFLPESIGNEIEKATTHIYPLQNVFIRKVKILKAPKFDLSRLMEAHGGQEDVGMKIDRPAEDSVAEAVEPNSDFHLWLHSCNAPIRVGTMTLEPGVLPRANLGCKPVFQEIQR
ncbi:unnamed protein product [Cuscuta campestris]|uniref:40S ribosomal protein S3a n=1 Tax=Cuscuta campestris TaxID=132261 RepID=A0A484M2W4_9ASTE|nr:unnamed protein product [Cuscuta campestris]